MLDRIDTLRTGGPGTSPLEDNPSLTEDYGHGTHRRVPPAYGSVASSMPNRATVAEAVYSICWSRRGSRPPRRPTGHASSLMPSASTRHHQRHQRSRPRPRRGRNRCYASALSTPHKPNDDPDAHLGRCTQPGHKDLEAPPEWIIVDPAAASFKVQLASDGILNVMNGENDVLSGIRLTASLLGSGHLLVSDRCQGIIQEAPGYSWDPKATEKGEDKPIKVADHSMDLNIPPFDHGNSVASIHQHTDRRMTECHCPQSAQLGRPKTNGPSSNASTNGKPWWSGDPDALRKAYAGTSVRPSLAARGGVAGAVKRFFWGEPGNSRQGSTKLHVPLAADICPGVR